MVSPLVAGSFLAGTTSVALAAYAWRGRDEPGGAAFATLMVGAAVWSLSYTVALFVFDPALRVTLEVPIEVGKAIIAPAWLAFALGYTGRGEHLSSRVVAVVMLFPAATLLVVAVPALRPLIWTNYHVVPTFEAATVLYEPQLWHYLHALYGYALVGTGMTLLFVEVLSSPYLYRDQLVALIVGSVVPTVAHLKRTFAVGPYPAVDFTPMALAFMGMTFGYALFRFELFGVVPATRHLGRRAAIDDVGVAVTIVDPDERVVELNAEAERLFGGRTASLGRSLSAVAPGVSLSQAAETDGGVESAGGHTVDLTVDGRSRTYEVIASPVEGRPDTPIGYTVAFHDVTAREARRQRLEVLNRVLRHNLRNDMTVVLGYAETLAAELPDDEAELARTIERKSRDLVTLGEKAREVESVMQAAPDDDALTRAAVDSLLDTVLDSLDDAGRVTVDVPPELNVATELRILRPVIRNAVENALEHTDGPVTVRAWLAGTADAAPDAAAGSTSAAVTADRATTAADSVVLEVADTGPGIPAHELDVVDEGTETPLKHGSGLGLWVVSWGARWLGAELTVDTSEGTTVRLRLPAA